MKSVIQWLKSLFSDERGSASSKRVIGMMCAIFLCITMYHNSFSEEHIAPSNVLVESVAALALGCLGLSSVDKYTFKKNNDTNV